MSNPFDRNKTKEAKLGQVITHPGEQNQRDAIHIAVVPIMAGCDLLPGQHVSVSPDGKTAFHNKGSNPTVGIVDPYFPPNGKILKGATFWLCLYQGSVNTLRHEWTHDAFPAVGSVAPSAKSESEIWLRAFASRIKPYDDADTAYADLLKELAEDEIYYHGVDSDWSVRDNHELWRHVSIVMGKIPNLEDLSIRCSC